MTYYASVHFFACLFFQALLTKENVEKTPLQMTCTVLSLNTPQQLFNVRDGFGAV